MDPASQPLLVDATVSGSAAAAAAADHSSAGQSQPQHFCARCSSELGLHHHDDPKRKDLRKIRIFVAIILSILMFAFSVVEMATAWQFHSPSILMLFVALWLVVTVVLLGILLYMGHRRHILGRTSIQIYILCGLACSWIIFMVAMMTQNLNACGWSSGISGLTCDMFTLVHLLSWVLIITLSSAAYVTYRRAVAIHGTALVAVQAPSPLIEAWRLSDIADVEGTIKI